MKVKTIKKKNKIILKSVMFFLLFGFTIELLAKPVDVETAKKVAQNFMNIRRSNTNAVLDVVVERFESQNSFYVINFIDGGWVMVSADDRAVPVLSYSYESLYRTEDEKPAGFLYLISEYNDQINFARNMDRDLIDTVKSKEIADEWAKLTSLKNTTSTKSYTAGTRLLNDPIRGEVAWGQTKNNNGGCTPSYNKYAPDEGGIIGWFGDCDCSKAPIGCAAVAMGQIMWYWQWPTSYNWSNMPYALLNSSSSVQGDAIANLLWNCAGAASMTYACLGSFAFPANVESALRNNFNFQAARLVSENDWASGVWKKLIRTEIDCERPVLYKGEKGLLNTDKHYFVIDGYDVNDNNKFHINFGWRGSNSWHHLDGIIGTNYNYNARQTAIIGISPTCPSAPSAVNITDVPYTTVTDTRKEEAQQTISLPASGKTLTVKNGGNLTFAAGKKIILGQGFKTEPGAKFVAKIEPSYSNETEIIVSSWPNAMNPNYGGLWLYVYNANSFDFTAVNRWNSVVYQNAGVISETWVDLWDGSGASSGNSYACNVRFRNNYGRILEKTWMVTVISFKSATIMDDHSFDEHYEYNEQNKNEIATQEISIYPNSNTGTFYIQNTANEEIQQIKIINTLGQQIYQSTNIQSGEIQIPDAKAGLYFVVIVTNNESITKKIVVN